MFINFFSFIFISYQMSEVSLFSFFFIENVWFLFCSVRNIITCIFFLFHFEKLSMNPCIPILINCHYKKLKCLCCYVSLKLKLFIVDNATGYWQFYVLIKLIIFTRVQFHTEASKVYFFFSVSNWIHWLDSFLLKTFSAFCE